MDPKVIDGLRKLYKSIVEGNKDAIKTYGELPETLPCLLTPRNDSVLHLAIQMDHETLAVDILRAYSDRNSLLHAKNDREDTILHEAAGTKMTLFVKELFNFAPNLLIEKNIAGETPLFKAALYGQTEMFKLLHGKMKKEKPQASPEPREDGATVLHAAILAGCYDLALEIATDYPRLTEAKDKDHMTALQILSNTPSAFKSGSDYGIVEKFIYICIPDEDTRVSKKVPKNYDACVDCLSLLGRSISSAWPIAERLKDDKKRHEAARKLALHLIQNDLSWEETCPREELSSISLGFPRAGRLEEIAKTEAAKAGAGDVAKKETTSSSQTRGDKGGGNKMQTAKTTLTPLLLSARNGIVEIVDMILEEHPQAIKHVSHEGQNILHVAIKHRQLEIFRRVMEKPLPRAILVRRFDNDWYTILHHVGIMPSPTGGHTQSTPAFHLQEELRWFECVRKMVPPHYELHRSKKGKTAFELFVEKHEELLKEARKWLMETSESCSIAAVLIAAVAFAAAYAVPGGSNKQNGVSFVTRDTFFLVFLVMDVISLASSLTSLVMFLSILRSPFQLQAFRHSLPCKLIFGLIFLFFSVAVAMLAFVAAIVLNIHLNKGWSTTLICSAAFIPVPIFALLQFPLSAAFGSTFKFCGKVISTIRRMSSPSCLSNNTTEAPICKDV